MSPCLWMHVTRRTGCFLSLSPGSFSLSFDSFLRCRGRSALSDAPSLCALRVRQWAADRGPCLPSGSAQHLSCAVEWSWRVGFFLREPPDVRILAGLFFSGSVPLERHSCPRGRLGREDPARMRRTLHACAVLCRLGWLSSLPSSRGLAEPLKLSLPERVSLCILTRFYFRGKNCLFLIL